MNQNEIILLSKAIAATAKTASEPMDDFIMGVYLKRLAPFALGPVLALLEGGVERRHLPTVAEMMNALEGRIEDRDEAQDCADRIVNAISSFGSYRSAEALAHLGELAAEVVKRFGGWAELCNVQTKELPVVRAQMRDAARAVLAKAKAGALGAPTALPQATIAPAGPKSAAALVGDLLPPRTKERL